MHGKGLAAGMAVLMIAGLTAHGVDAPQPQPWTLPEIFRHIAPLQTDPAGRLPLICMNTFRLGPDDKSFEQAQPWPADVIRELARRGLTQWIPPRTNYIEFARALQTNGAGVVIFEGNAFNGPAEEEVPGGAGLHQLPADFKPDERPPQQMRYPCPLLLAGWQRRADKLRATYRVFRDAGIRIDAAWYDWEIEPYPGESEWKEAKACSRCRTQFPPGVLDDFDQYRAFITRWRNDVFSAYLAAPILEFYPRISLTNWELVLSSAEHPTRRWSCARTFAPSGIGLFTAANPVAYGNTAWYEMNWKKEWNWPLDAAHMDRVYTEVMFGQISGNAENERTMAPEKQCIPWVDRVCLDDPNEKIPLLTRPRYREILRHCWLRGADSMQVFNPAPGAEAGAARIAIVNEEIEDALAVYDEMLAYRRFLDRGVVLNTAFPAATDDGPVWSGLRLGDEAVVRAFTQAPKAVKVTITPFAGGLAVELSAPPAGATYLLAREGDKIKVREGK